MWTAVEEGDGHPAAHAQPDDATTSLDARVGRCRSPISASRVKDSPQNTLVFVTRLDTGAPVAGANVSIVRLDNSVVLDRDAPAPTAWRWRPTRRCAIPTTGAKFAFIVTAEKDGDVAYVGSDWNEGIQPWEFGSRFNLARGDAAAARHGVHRSRRLQVSARKCTSRRSCVRTRRPASVCFRRARRSSSPCATARIGSSTSGR